MAGRDLPSRFTFLLSWRKLGSVLAVVGVLTFALWTLPNWREFWSHISQFPSLWQIPTNRRIIVYLTIKVASPLLITGIIAIIVWIYSLMKLSQSEEGTNNVRSQQVQHEKLAEKRSVHSTSPSMLEQKSQTHIVSFSTPARTQSPLVSQRYDPETPLPPTLSVLGASKRIGRGIEYLSRSCQKRAASPTFWSEKRKQLHR